MTHQYSFDEMLAMSEGENQKRDVAEILMNNIPGALNVHKAGETNDRNGTDWWVEHASGRHLSVDCKVRAQDWSLKGKDDLALETWSVVERSKVGWTRNKEKRKDYILWLWIDTGRWCLLPFSMLSAVFIEHWQKWRNEFGPHPQETPTRTGIYTSECVFVPRTTVWRAMYDRFGGVTTDARV